MAYATEIQETYRRMVRHGWSESASTRARAEEIVRDAHSRKVHRCHKCGYEGLEAIDQTDPTDRQTAIDSRGLVAANEWVCGACLAAAEEGA